MKLKFEQYVTKLHNTPYFKDVEKGSKQYNARLEKAKQKFLKKYSGQEEVRKVPVERKEEQVRKVQVRTEPSAEQLKEAEEWKEKGNSFFKQSNHVEAINCYSEAIKIDPTSPKSAVYYSNRAASYQHLNKPDQVIRDCVIAIENDPNYSKPYMRLG